MTLPNILYNSCKTEQSMNNRWLQEYYVCYNCDPRVTLKDPNMPHCDQLCHQFGTSNQQLWYQTATIIVLTHTRNSIVDKHTHSRVLLTNCACINMQNTRSYFTLLSSLRYCGILFMTLDSSLMLTYTNNHTLCRNRKEQSGKFTSAPGLVTFFDWRNVLICEDTALKEPQIKVHQCKQLVSHL